MRYLMTIILCLILSAPAFAEEDSYKQIVEDYKVIEKLFTAGKINQAEHRAVLIEFQQRVEILQEKSCVKSSESGRTFCLSPPYCAHEDCLIILKIASGFTQEPS